MKISSCSLVPSFRYGVGGDNVEDAAAPSLAMLQEIRHNHVPHSSLIVAYSGVPSLRSPFIRDATNERSDIEAGT